jgi:hypothetical protein
MGYDFSFIIVAPRPRVFPFYLSKEFEGRVEPLRDKDAVERFLLSDAGFRHNGPPVAGTQFYRWSRPDEGILYVSVREKSVHIDTHVHWNSVLKLYEVLRLIEPELLIVDNQTAMLYDGDSYRIFVDESYARKT